MKLPFFVFCLSLISTAAFSQEFVEGEQLVIPVLCEGCEGIICDICSLSSDEVQVLTDEEMSNILSSKEQGQEGENNANFILEVQKRSIRHFPIPE